MRQYIIIAIIFFSRSSPHSRRWSWYKAYPYCNSC